MIKEFKKNSVDIATVLEVNQDMYLNIYDKCKDENEIELFPICLEDTIFHNATNEDKNKLIILTIYNKNRVQKIN